MIYPNCGTYAGYRKHHNNKTKPCVECLAASSVYNRLRYAKNNRAHVTAKYRASNLDKVRDRERSKNRRRRAKITNDYNELQVVSVYGIDCYLCGLEIDFMAPRKCGIDGWEHGLHIDHLVPLAKGGSDTLENVRPAHGLCNLRKWANQG
jgi:5-methylcytosine-specific restriction endonuclease McrA